MCVRAHGSPFRRAHAQRWHEITRYQRFLIHVECEHHPLLSPMIRRMAHSLAADSPIFCIRAIRKYTNPTPSPTMLIKLPTTLQQPYRQHQQPGLLQRPQPQRQRQHRQQQHRPPHWQRQRLQQIRQRCQPTSTVVVHFNLLYESIFVLDFVFSIADFVLFYFHFVCSMSHQHTIANW